MIVYVESNFVLELAYLQETRSACAGILALAEAGSISMVVPAFCLIECRMSWSLKAKRRAIVNEDLQSQIRELARSAPYTNIIEQSREITAALIESSEEDRRRLDEVLERIGRACIVEPLRDETVQSALKYERTFRLSPQDSTILATVLQHAVAAGSGDKMFVNKNWKDFANPDIDEALKKYNCISYQDPNKALQNIPGAKSELRKYLLKQLTSK